jgi:peptidylprolyl isomerase
MAGAQIGDRVKVHYLGKLQNGTVFDTTLAREPVEFTIGQGQVIPGFEQAVIGLEPGEQLTVTIPAEKAFGAYREEMVQMVHTEQLPEDVDAMVGKQLRIPQQDGGGFVVTVTDVSDEVVTLDANHPLAGEDLTFEIRLEEIL